MVQVRCPECGYIQTLSEERFLSLSDDFLSCPHCNAKVPKEWNPQEDDAVPEEARHKMLAFSRRILNGGGVAREVVFALESLVRRYGPMEESNKALGLGYAAMGEKNKAEEFLKAARQESPKDAQVLRCLLDILLSRKKFSEVADTGEKLMNLDPLSLRDDDTARIALAYLGMKEAERAKALLDSYPHLDPRNSLVKRARKELNRLSGSGIRSLFSHQWPLQRLWAGSGRESLKALGAKAKDLVAGVGRSDATKVAASEYSPNLDTGGHPVKPPVSLEYWVYSTDCTIPSWDDIRDGLVDVCSGRSERQRIFKFLETVIERNDLTIEYILRQESEELFEYPEDLIPCNSRELTDEDRKVLADARMIVRLRLCLPDFSGTEHLVATAKFVETVRNLANGVVQDAISHVLWGTEQWKKHAQNPTARLVDSNVHFEMLADDGNVWVHSHGMQKFGIPDIEIEDIPERLALRARALMVVAAEILIASKDQLPEFTTEIVIPGTHVALNVEPQSPDPEGHFSAGSLKLSLFPAGEDVSEPERVMELLSTFSPPLRSHSSVGRKSEPAETSSQPEGNAAIRRELLDAHKKARADLPLFKRSFQQRADSGEHVHAVKVGFPAQGGAYEWMWVTLDAWRGQSIVGFLENEPVLRKDLDKGSRVQITEGEIFDWVIADNDQVLEGGYTERITA